MRDTVVKGRTAQNPCCERAFLGDRRRAPYAGCMDDVFGAGGALAEVPAGLRAAPRAGRARSGGRRCPRGRRAPARRSGHGHGQEPRVPHPGAVLRSPRRRGHSDESPSGAAAHERRSDRRCGARTRGEGGRAQGPPELPLPQGASRFRAARRLSCCDERRTQPRSTACALVRRDGDGRPRRASFRAVGHALGASWPSAPTAASAASAPFTATCFSEAARRQAPSRRSRHREPRALLRRPRPARGDRRLHPPRARRRRFRRGAPPRGHGGLVARRRRFSSTD